jgi:hypothetical protein
MQEISDLQNYVKRAKIAEANFAKTDPVATLLVKKHKNKYRVGSKTSIGY